ncbi:DUF4838 domain-containing protein [Bacteroides sedimenti]
MNTRYKTKVLLLLLSFISQFAFAQIVIVKNEKPMARIAVNRDDSIDLKAALLFQDFTNRITGVKLKIISTEKSRRGDVLIGNHQLPLNNVKASDITEDGFYISSTDGYLRIVKGSGKGTVYGVVTLLEDYFGIHYYAAETYSINKSKDMIVPSGICRVENPSFRYRQTQSYSLKDPMYKLWHRLEEPEEVFAGDLWVHTFNKLLPAAEFGEKHPEYYSFINGQRRPGVASQWCLTNPDVFEIVAHRLDSIFKANTGMKIISVSQNDSQTHCSCSECKAIDEYEGSPSGTIVFFLNKLAARFPDKEFSTLAYLYSVPPPKHIKPLPNVNIMLCDIDCYREVPLTENSSGKAFINNMERWSKITNNIFVWDYGINFDNYISPFPNFHVLQPNMELFKKNKATMHFSQIASIKGGDFSELRSYLVAKLLWNTSVNVDSVIRSFLDGYYGKASPYLYNYLILQKGALLGSNIPLWIYDTPVTHKSGMLNKVLMKQYNELFDEAEKAVANNRIFLNRVRESRLSIQYAELEIARTEPIGNVAVLKEKLDLFRQRAKDLGVVSLNERNNTIEEYCDLYSQRNFSQKKINLAQGAEVSYIIPAEAPYDKIAGKALTDGLYGGTAFNESWVGWLGKNADFVIDLNQNQEVRGIEVDFLHKLGAWILLPKKMSCYTSTDNKNFTLMGTTEIVEDRDPQVKYVNIPIKFSKAVHTRYIKVNIETIGLCPAWHYGVGNPAWFFIDEVLVY